MTTLARWCGVHISDVELLRLDVATHAGVLGIRNRAIAHRHPLRGHLERHVEEYREVPRARQLFAVQEQPVDDKDRTCGGDRVRRVEDQIAGQVVRRPAIASRPAGTRRDPAAPARRRAAARS